MDEARVFENEQLGRWAYASSWAIVSGASRPVEVWLRSLDVPPRPVSRRVLRAVEVYEGERRAAEMHREAARIGGAMEDRLERIRAMQPEEGARRGGRPPLSDELLDRFATLYRATNGDLEAIQREMHISASTLRKYRLRARARTDPATGRKFLDTPGPTTPGKAGEQE